MTDLQLICLVCHSVQKPIFEYHGYQYTRCPACGLVSTWPVPDRETIEQHYESKARAGNYELLREYADPYRTIYEGFANIIEKNIGRRVREVCLLDIGCFTGDFLQVMAERGAEVYGVELQTDAAAEANRRFPGRVHKGEVEALELPLKEFDVVSLNGLIEHVIDPVRLIESVAERISDRGLVFIETPNSTSILARLMGRYWPPYSPVEHINLFSIRSLSLLLKKAGLNVCAVFPHWKKLPSMYVFRMLENFSPELQRLAAPIFKYIPRSMAAVPLPFYGGEMIVLARKRVSSAV
jgi:SAM-dependent methyltransferase